jgi:hypothetical protein
MRPHYYLTLAVLVCLVGAPFAMGGGTLTPEQRKKTEEAKRQRQEQKAKDLGVPLDVVESEENLLDEAEQHIDHVNLDVRTYHYLDLIITIFLPLISFVVTALAAYKTFIDRDSNRRKKSVTNLSYRLILYTAIISGGLTLLNALNSSLKPAEHAATSLAFQDRLSSFKSRMTGEIQLARLRLHGQPDYELKMREWMQAKKIELNEIISAWHKGEKVPREPVQDTKPVQESKPS